jgi:hypothetical protein
MDRTRLIGWAIVIFAGGSLLYYLKVRLLTAGPPLERKEWLQGIGLVVLLIIGTINVRLAAIGAQRQQSGRR